MFRRVGLLVCLCLALVQCEEEVIKCTGGECVKLHLCPNGELNTDGANIIDIRFNPDNECEDYLLKCCPVADDEDEDDKLVEPDTSAPIVPTTKPSAGADPVPGTVPTPAPAPVTGPNAGTGSTTVHGTGPTPPGTGNVGNSGGSKPPNGAVGGGGHGGVGSGQPHGQNHGQPHGQNHGQPHGQNHGQNHGQEHGQNQGGCKGNSACGGTSAGQDDEQSVMIGSQDFGGGKKPVSGDLTKDVEQAPKPVGGGPPPGVGSKPPTAGNTGNPGVPNPTAPVGTPGSTQSPGGANTGSVGSGGVGKPPGQPVVPTNPGSVSGANKSPGGAGTNPPGPGSVPGASTPRPGQQDPSKGGVAQPGPQPTGTGVDGKQKPGPDVPITGPSGGSQTTGPVPGSSTQKPGQPNVTGLNAIGGTVPKPDGTASPGYGGNKHPNTGGGGGIGGTTNTLGSSGAGASTHNPLDKTVDVPQKCGVRNADGVGFRITGDNDGESEYGEFPWMVAILKEEKALDQVINVYQCGGSLIHPSVVLTAAHCVQNRKAAEIKVRLGEWDTQTKNEIYDYQDRNVVEIVTHAEFYKGGLFNDVALLFLEQPANLMETVNTICLPPKDYSFDLARCFASGWGKDVFGKQGTYQVILKKIELPIMPRDQCQTALRSTRLGRRFKLHTSFICAGGEKGRDTCKGDGGSPLMCPIPGTVNQYYQAGMVAWGIGCGEDGIPGVYVNVPMFRGWIDEHLTQRNFAHTYYLHT